MSEACQANAAGAAPQAVPRIAEPVNIIALEWDAEAERLRSLVRGIPSQPDPETIGELTRSVNVIQAAIEAIDDGAEHATEFTKRRKLIPNALACAVIRPYLMVAERYVDGALEVPSRFVLRSVLYPSERILVIKRSLQIDTTCPEVR